MKLVKKINSPGDLELWEKSEAYNDVLGFIQSVSRAIIGKKNSDNTPCSENINKVCEILNKLKEKVNDFPPLEQPQRFGNKAFRTYSTWFVENSQNLVSTHLPIPDNESKQSVVEELAEYLTESFGNATRIDYGTGHELAFLLFLICLFKVGILSPDTDFPAIGLKVMKIYLETVRRIQTAYRMEPAGSQGVWSLDDFQFVPYIWGSSQLMNQSEIDPTAIGKREYSDRYAEDYLLFGCLKYIHQVKSGPFEEHSNTLYNISGLPHWEKVNSGLIKMYKGEVMAKFPVVQHVLFGNLVKLDPASHFKQPLPAASKQPNTTAKAPL